MYTVPVKVPVATRDEGDDDSDAAVEFRTMFDGMVLSVRNPARVFLRKDELGSPCRLV